ncbi:MAG TPA: hypothetical protein VF666_15860 [Pyrinomonadaceae bacterium]
MEQQIAWRKLWDLLLMHVPSPKPAPEATNKLVRHEQEDVTKGEEQKAA